MISHFKAAEKELPLQNHLIDTALDLFNGIYLITPFLRYELTVELTIYTHQTASRIEEEQLCRKHHLLNN